MQNITLALHYTIRMQNQTQDIPILLKVYTRVSVETRLEG